MNKLLTLKAPQFDILTDKLTRAGVRLDVRTHAGRDENRVFYQMLSDMGFSDVRAKIGRCAKPDYTALGFNRVAGAPTEEEIARYSQVTSGATLTDKGLVCQALLFDNDLITDRYHAATMNLLVDLYTKYVGRSNDFNHYFDVTQARCRVIDTHLGTDPGTKLHQDIPVEAISRLSPANAFSGVYTALYGTLAFPYLENDPHQVLEKVCNGMIKDLSLAFFEAPKTTYCSICLEPMDVFWFWDYCEEHGFPGGQTDSGERVVAIMDRAMDALTFGLVSDGAVARACLVLDPKADPPADTDE